MEKKDTGTPLMVERFCLCVTNQFRYRDTLQLAIVNQQ